MDENDAQGATRRLAAGSIDRDLRWLAPGLLAGCVVAVGYALTHPYPAFGAGLYLLMAERVGDAGYALPETIPYYASGGVPFAYPPLFFYVVAALVDLGGLDPILVSRALPGAFTVAYLVPFYALARRLGYARPGAGLATVLLATFPPVLQWHLSAGGVVRAGAFLLALVGCYAGCRLFRDGDDRWLAPTAVALGATALAHPLYLAFLLVSLAVFVLAFDRSAAGFVRGGAVGVGGLLVAAPWWTTVVATHGWGVFAAAAGTHGGFGDAVASTLGASTGSLAPGRPYLHVPTLLALAYLVHRRRLLLPGWFAAVGLTVGKPRLLYVFAALFAAALLFDPVLPWLHRVGSDRGIRRRTVVPLAVVFLLSATGGVLYATGQLDASADSSSLPAFVDADDREAMAWAGANTARGARFVVVGDAAEWFPYFARRPLVVGPWGAEWVDAGRYYRQVALFKRISHCERVACLTGALAGTSVRLEYVYVPTDPYTVRGMVHDHGPRLAESLRSSGRFRQVYENDGVVIFRLVR